MADLEEAERQAKRNETIELQKHYKKAKADASALEKHIEELVNEEAERQYKMRQAQWDREKQARVNLLKDVYISREKDILLKQEKKREDAWFKDHEKKQLSDALAAQ